MLALNLIEIIKIRLKSIEIKINAEVRVGFGRSRSLKKVQANINIMCLSHCNVYVFLASNYNSSRCFGFYHGH